jgi:hypothetical protein
VRTAAVSVACSCISWLSAISCSLSRAAALPWAPAGLGRLRPGAALDSARARVALAICASLRCDGYTWPGAGKQDTLRVVKSSWCDYGYASDYKKSVHAKCFLNSWYFKGYGPGYGMLFRLFSAILRYSPLFSDQNVSSISYSRDFL